MSDSVRASVCGFSKTHSCRDPLHSQRSHFDSLNAGFNQIVQYVLYLKILLYVHLDSELDMRIENIEQWRHTLSFIAMHGDGGRTIVLPSFVFVLFKIFFFPSNVPRRSNCVSGHVTCSPRRPPRLPWRVWRPCPRTCSAPLTQICWARSRKMVISRTAAEYQQPRTEWVWLRGAWPDPAPDILADLTSSPPVLVLVNFDSYGKRCSTVFAERHLAPRHERVKLRQLSASLKLAQVLKVASWLTVQTSIPIFYS